MKCISCGKQLQEGEIYIMKVLDVRCGYFCKKCGTETDTAKSRRIIAFAIRDARLQFLREEIAREKEVRK